MRTTLVIMFVWLAALAAAAPVHVHLPAAVVPGIVEQLYSAGITLERAPEEQQLLEVWTIYDKTDRKWFQLTPGKLQINLNAVLFRKINKPP